MATFVVMERREAGEDDAEPICDGFGVLAFLVPPIWMLWHRLWIEAGVYLVLALALSGLGWMLGMGDASGLMGLTLNLLVGLEASTLRQAALRRRGWEEWGPVEARDQAEAMTRYLVEAGHLEAETETVPALPMRYTHAPATGPALGLFAYPDRR